MPVTSPSTPVVLVTGASSGIGRATARLFAERGARVFGTSRSARPDEGGVEMLELDVRSEESVRRCVDQVLDRAGQLDVVVNNVGVMYEGFAEETPLAQAEMLLDTNFLGAVRVGNAVLPAMRERRRGRIVNVGSLAAWVGEPGQGFYAASKAALARYTEALRHEVRHLGVHVSLVEPGPFKTRVLDASSQAEPVVDDYDGPREDVRRALHKELREGDEPRAAAELIWKVARDPAPRRRYGVGRGALLVPRLKTLLPRRLVDRLLRRAYRLPR
ncbi:SDR family NAD(P)-dependent oxidoreductase [Actinomadura welshii]